MAKGEVEAEVGIVGRHDEQNKKVQSKTKRTFLSAKFRHFYAEQDK
jgi:hypothetical protein